MYTLPMYVLGDHLSTRMQGKEFYQSVKDAIEQGNIVRFDFTNVETITNSFADEVFGKLASEYPNFKEITTIVNANDFCAMVIANAVNNRINLSKQ